MGGLDLRGSRLSSAHVGGPGESHNSQYTCAYCEDKLGGRRKAILRMILGNAKRFGESTRNGATLVQPSDAECSEHGDRSCYRHVIKGSVDGAFRPESGRFHPSCLIRRVVGTLSECQERCPRLLLRGISGAASDPRVVCARPFQKGWIVDASEETDELMRF